MNGAFLRRRDQTARPLRVGHYSRWSQPQFWPKAPLDRRLICICMDASRMARTDVRVMGQADCSFVFGLFLQELSLLALMESADPRLISSVGSWP